MEAIVTLRGQGGKEIYLADCTYVFKHTTYSLNSAEPHVCTHLHTAVIHYSYLNLGCAKLAHT